MLWRSNQLTSKNLPNLYLSSVFFTPRIFTYPNDVNYDNHNYMFGKWTYIVKGTDHWPTCFERKFNNNIKTS
jgi:hypothetical protein